MSEQRVKTSRKVEKQNDLSVQEMCTIIEVCAKHGVRKLKFASLEIELGQAHTVEHPAAPINLEKQHEEMQIAEQAVVEEDAEELKLQRLLEMQVKDPFMYEQVLEKLEADGNAATLD